MKSCWLSIAVVFGLALPGFAANKVQPVRMGCGMIRSGSSCMGQSVHTPVFSSFHWNVYIEPGSDSE